MLLAIVCTLSTVIICTLCCNALFYVYFYVLVDSKEQCTDVSVQDTHLIILYIPYMVSI